MLFLPYPFPLSSSHLSPSATLTPFPLPSPQFCRFPRHPPYHPFRSLFVSPLPRFPPSLLYFPLQFHNPNFLVLLHSPPLLHSLRLPPPTTPPPPLPCDALGTPSQGSLSLFLKGGIGLVGIPVSVAFIYFF